MVTKEISLTSFASATAEQKKKVARRQRAVNKSLFSQFEGEVQIKNVGLLPDGTTAIVIQKLNSRGTPLEEFLTFEYFYLYPLRTYEGSKEFSSLSLEEIKAIENPPFEGLLSTYEDTKTKLFEFGEFLQSLVGHKCSLKIVESSNIIRFYDGKYYLQKENFYITLI